MGKHLTGYMTMLAGGLVLGFGLGGDLGGDSALPTEAQSATPPETQVASNNQRPSAPPATKPQQAQIVNSKAKSPLSIAEVIDTPILFQRLSGAYQLAQNADTDELSDMLDDLTEQQSDYNMTLVARVFFIRWAQLDPAGAIDKYYRLYEEPKHAINDIAYGLYHQWAMQDMGATLAYIESSTPEKIQESIYRYLVDDEHFTDNQALIAQASNHSEYLNAFVVTKQTKDLPIEQQFDALLALGLSDRALNREIYRILKLWAKSAPEQAVLRLSELTKSNKQAKRWLEAVLRQWAKDTPEQALLAALNLPNGQQYADTVIRGISFEDPQKAMEIYALHSDKLNAKLQKTIFSTWSSKDPKAAMAYIDQLDQKQKQAILRNSRFLWSFARNSAADAFEFAKRNDMLKDRSNLFTVANALVNEDMDKAMSLWAAQPEGSIRNALMSHIVKNIGQTDVNAALKWLDENNSDTKANRQARSMLYSQWVKTDPYAAAEDAVAGSTDDSQKYLVLTLLSNWYRSDPNEAVKWVSTLNDQALKDKALSTLVSMSYRQDIDLAKRLASQISNEKLRQRTMQMIRY